MAWKPPYISIDFFNVLHLEIYITLWLVWTAQNLTRINIKLSIKLQTYRSKALWIFFVTHIHKYIQILYRELKLSMFVCFRDVVDGKPPAPIMGNASGSKMAARPSRPNSSGSGILLFSFAFLITVNPSLLDWSKGHQ